jgi:predicted ATPase
LIGEAGIGKSRLAEEFSQWVGQQNAIVVTAHCYAAEGNLPYGPVAQWLRAEAIFATLPGLDLVTRTEIARLLPEIWGEQASLSPTNLLTEGWQRQGFFEALARAMLACQRPLLLILDNLQWCDQDSLEWLHYLLRFDPQAPLLLLATLRPEEITPDHPLQTLRWQLGYSEAIREIELGRLNVQETARLAASLLSQPLPVQSTTQLYNETEGNPLFVVELVRAGLARPTVNPQRLPPRLQAVITARLKRLSPFGRELAGMAAAIGRNFDVELLKQISSSDDDTLVRGLEELWQQQVIREQGTGLYDFSHDKIREVAYAHLSPAQRQLIHRRIAAGLEQRYGRGPHPASNRIAAHYEQAGQIEEAVLAYREAAAAARTLSAREVLAYLTTSLDLLQRLPASPQRDRLELDLLLEQGATLMQARGNADPDVAATFERARKLLLKMDDLLQIGPILWGLWSFYNVRAQYDMAHQLAEQIRQTAQLVADPTLEVVMDAALGITYLYRGQLALAHHHIERALSNYHTAPEQCGPPSYPLDLSILLLPYAGWTEWLLGQPDQALARCTTAIERAKQQNQRLDLAYAHVLTAFVHYLGREPDQMRAHATAGRSLAEQYGYDILAASTVIFGNWVELMEQPNPDLLEQIEQGLAAWQSNEAGMQVSSFLAMLAEAQGRCGQQTAGLATLERALAHMAMHGECFFEAELYRLQGELHWAVGDEDAAEASFQQALAVAQAQNSRMLALRAATSLAQLWQQQGRATEAGPLLAEIYGQFEEGFSTLDLQTAQALLVELTEQSY